MPLPPQTDFETLLHIGSFDLELGYQALGDKIIPKGAAQYDFIKMDSPMGQRVLSLTFKSLVEYGGMVNGPNGPEDRFSYIWNFWKRNKIQQTRIFIVAGPERDMTQRYYYFPDSIMTVKMVEHALWTSGIRLLQTSIPGWIVTM